jgi:Tfp pilus assembly protein PilF
VSLDETIRDDFDQAIALSPWNIEYQIDEARYLLSKGDTQSVTVYENLTRIDPGDPGTFTSLAWAYHALYQNDTKALQSLDQAFAVDKNYYEAWLVLGRIQEAKGNIPEAIAAYWKSAEANQTDVQALGSLGSLYEANKNTAGMARAAFELMQRSPDSASAQSVFADFGLSIKVEHAAVDGRQASGRTRTIPSSPRALGLGSAVFRRPYHRPFRTGPSDCASMPWRPRHSRASGPHGWPGQRATSWSSRLPERFDTCASLRYD